MAYETILKESKDSVSVITLNRPDELNTFNTILAEELYDALIESDNDDSVKVILIKGNGKAFCAGIDVKELEGKNTLQYRQWVEKMERPLHGIAKMNKPVIVQHHGVAAANGMGVVASADLVISSEKSRMGLTAINVGLNCVGPVIPVSKCVGRKKALELLFYGNLIGSEEALKLGLINRIVPDDELEDTAFAWAKELAAKSPVALQIAKTAFYMSEDMPYEKQFAFMNEAFARLCSTDDAKEGVSAFFEKREPNWKCC